MRNAAIGLLARSGLDLLEAALGRPAPSAGKPPWARLGAYAGAAVLACAYAQIVPPEHWGARSGIAFSELRVVGMLAKPSRDALAAELMVWGAGLGLLMRALGEPPASPGLRLLPLLKAAHV